METLTQASHKLAEEMYKRPPLLQAAGCKPVPSCRPTAERLGAGKKNEDVIDAEYEVKE